ncbi:MAG: hypothetical protein AEth_01637 [Candidatus Argoarchaeum ethanivorans]|uniref:Uncharacterized protein n=1 Tax=Candidatus Argoarchaeum ethanivorans TaxID=2608793 RepID=A0A8B3S1C4_9EURY|nr:MAG: hypothetical protein AEth_01637 [Candidatus Argoarchaeum ethanivorans]
MDNKGAKILAIFLVSTMVLSSIAYFVGNTDENQTNETLPTDEPTDFFDVGGQLISEPFTSMQDALKITPSGAVHAEYVNLKTVANTSMESFVLSQLQSEGLPVEQLNKLYDANTDCIYFAGFNSSFILMTTFKPQYVTFNFVATPYRYYNLLLRQDTDATNVMGNPTIYGAQNDVINTLDVIDGVTNHTSYDDYEAVLTKAPPAEYQRITNSVPFAEQFYSGLTNQENNTVLRTTIYYNLNETTQSKFEALQQNSTERGFSEYNITTADNLTVVNIKSTFLNVISEDDR